MLWAAEIGRCEVPACAFCGRVMLAGICCEERRIESARLAEEHRRKEMSERMKARHRKKMERRAAWEAAQKKAKGGEKDGES